VSTSKTRYEHPSYPSGTIVFVDPKITEIRPLAGKRTKTCQGFYYEILDLLEHRDHNTLVPCVYGIDIYYVEEDYVSPMEETEKR
jgi:hypothetical protein